MRAYGLEEYIFIGGIVMRKLKMLAFGFVMAATMLFATACGGPDNPTAEDVEDAIEDEGYIDKDRTDEDGNKIKYDVKVDKVKLNDDKDKAKVDATVSYSYGPVEYSQEYNLTFKLKDKKESKWKCKEVEKDGDLVQKLVEEVDDETVEEILGDISYSLSDSIYVYSSDVTGVKIKEHNLDEEEMIDTVKVEVTAETAMCEYTFNATADFSYYYGWSYSNVEVDSDYDFEYTDEYKFTYTADEVAEQLKNSFSGVRCLGYTRYFSDGKVTNFELEDAEPDGTNYLYTDVSFDFECDDLKMSVTATLEYYYYQSDKEWSLYDIDDIEKEVECVYSGTWKGTNADGETLTVTVSDEYDEDEDTFPATVEFASKDNGTYSWNSELDSYYESGSKMTFDFYFDSWITKPADGNQYDYFSVACEEGSTKDTLELPSYVFDGSLTRQ